MFDVDLSLNLSAAFGPILKESFPDASPRWRYAVAGALAEAVIERRSWFAVSSATSGSSRPYASDKDLIEAAVQAALDAGLAENGVHGVAAARHAARFVVESREYWRNIERANLAEEVRQIKEAKQTAASPAQEVDETERQEGVPISDWSWWVGSDEGVTEEGRYDLYEASEREDAIDWAECHVEPGERFHIIEARCRALEADDEFMPFVAKRNRATYIVDSEGRAALSAPDEGEGL